MKDLSQLYKKTSELCSAEEMNWLLQESLQLDEEMRVQIRIREQEDEQKYVECFLKKSILRNWKQVRGKLQCYHLMPTEAQKVCLEAMWQQIKTPLLSAFREDYHLPLLSLTLYGWLYHVTAVAGRVAPLQKGYWQEIEYLVTLVCEQNWIDWDKSEGFFD
jgi:hypothetical protein